MYVTNVDKIDPEKVYECNGVIAEYLIYQKHISLLSRNQKLGKWYFAKTDNLEKALEEMPFWLNIAKCF